MADPHEIEALKASLRGALGTAGALAGVQGRIDALDNRAGISAEDLEELGRVSLANAVAAQALRALVESMRTRLGA